MTGRIHFKSYSWPEPRRSYSARPLRAKPIFYYNVKTWVEVELFDEKLMRESKSIEQVLEVPVYAGNAEEAIQKALGAVPLPEQSSMYSVYTQRAKILSVGEVLND